MEKLEFYPYQLKKIDDFSCAIKRYIGEELNITIPESIGGLTVKEIHRNAFWDIPIVRVVIPETVYLVEYEAFNDCYSLKWVIVRSTDTKIAKGEYGDGLVYAPVFITQNGNASVTKDVIKDVIWSTTILTLKQLDTGIAYINGNREKFDIKFYEDSYETGLEVFSEMIVGLFPQKLVERYEGTISEESAIQYMEDFWKNVERNDKDCSLLFV